MKSSNRLILAGAALLALLALGAEVSLFYGRALAMGFWGDDWPLLAQARCIACVVAFRDDYHYTPIAVLLRFGMYSVFGTDTFAFHLIALTLFWVCAVMVLYAGWRLTGHLGTGVVAGLLFVGYGTQYEAAIWSVVAYLQLPALMVYLAGLLCYRSAHDPRASRRARAWAYAGFIVALVLGPFIYEPDVTLLVACFLYRVLVLDHWRAVTRAQLFRVAREWLRDFALPAVLLVGYLGFKVWFGQQVGRAQAPGLAIPLLNQPLRIEQGIWQTFVPGIGSNQLITLSFFSIALRFYLVVLAAQLLLLGVVCFVGKPIHRFLVGWSLLLVVSQLIGLGTIQSRHLLLITVPGAILSACLVVALGRQAQSLLGRLRGTGFAGLALRLGCIGLLVGAFTLVGYRCATAELDAWNTSSVEMNRVLTQVAAYARTDPQATNLYLINLPDSQLSSYGDYVYIFRNAPAAAVNLTLPHRFRQVVVAHTMPVRPIVSSYSRPATAAQIAQWSVQPKTLVLVYDAASGQLIRHAGT